MSDEEEDEEDRRERERLRAEMKLHGIESTTPKDPTSTIKEIEARDTQLKTEMASGRAGGFTEIRPLARRQTAVGAGIQSFGAHHNKGLVGRGRGSEDLDLELESPPSVGEASGGMAKALRRMSTGWQ